MTLLIRTPALYPTESLLGFILRVAEANGYESPRYIWSLAQVPRGAEMAPRLPIEELAGILGQCPDDLRRIAYRANFEGRGAYKILDHALGDDLRGGPLRLKQPAFCPQCVAEQGYLDAFWDLSAAVACPIHRRKVLHNCPAGGRPITWMRPALLRCGCGASLADAVCEPASDPLCELMKVIQARLYRRPIDAADRATWLPMAPLASIPLSPLIRMLAVLGTQVLDARNIAPVRDAMAVAEAAEVLADWPHGYHRFLSQLGSRSLAKQPHAVGLRKQFRRFYDAIFRNPTFAAHAAFLREEFLRFGLREWGRAAVDHKLLRHIEAKDSGRFVSKAEFVAECCAQHSATYVEHSDMWSWRTPRSVPHVEPGKRAPHIQSRRSHGMSSDPLIISCPPFGGGSACGNTWDSA
jgi:hypothetical protein